MKWKKNEGIAICLGRSVWNVMSLHGYLNCIAKALLQLMVHFFLFKTCLPRDYIQICKSIFILFLLFVLTFSTTVTVSIGKTDIHKTSAVLPYIANVTHREQTIDRKGLGSYRLICNFSCFQIHCWTFSILLKVILLTSPVICFSKIHACWTGILVFTSLGFDFSGLNLVDLYAYGLIKLQY